MPLKVKAQAVPNRETTSTASAGPAMRDPTITDVLGPLPADWSGEIQGGANVYNWQVPNGYGPGQVTGISLTTGGSGYTAAPTVTFSAPARTGGKPATGTAVLGTGATSHLEPS